jgi:Domain of unknown function (DUF6532)
MIVDVIWQKGLHEYIDPLRLDSTIALAGAALQNALKAYRTGRFKSIDASAEQFYDTYHAILVLIDSILADPALKLRYERLQELIVSRDTGP